MCCNIVSFFSQLALGMFPYPQVSFPPFFHPNMSFFLSDEQSSFYIKLNFWIPCNVFSCFVRRYFTSL